MSCTLEDHGLLRVVRHDEELILLHGIDDDRPIWSGVMSML